MAENIRVRIAPSPTGKFHIGTARTALFNYLFAKKHGGTFILRIEDSDKERSEEQYTKDIINSLLWLGLGWDEGPEVGGDKGPYLTSERLDIYKKYTDQLLQNGLAYKCYCSAEELEAEKQAQQDKHQAPKYSGRCRSLTKAQIDSYEQAGRQPVIRFKVEPQKVTFTDLIRDEVTFDAGLVGDFVIIRSDGMPLFVFYNAIDDNLMEISHVLRGEEHLSNTTKQILLNTALGFLNPQFGHLPLILNKDRSKMSKRKDPVSVSDDFKAKGYLPEALVNFIALLGWSNGEDKEIFTLPELIEEFEIERVGKSPSIFDLEKLNWMNGSYIRSLPIGEIATRAQSFITDKTLLAETLKRPDIYLEAIALVRDRLKTLAEIEEAISFLFIRPEYAAELLVAKKSTPERTVQALAAAHKELSGLSQFGLDDTEKTLRATALEAKLEAGELLWSVRVALSGRSASPGAFELLAFLGKDETLARLSSALKNLGS